MRVGYGDRKLTIKDEELVLPYGIEDYVTQGSGAIVRLMSINSNRGSDATIELPSPGANVLAVSESAIEWFVEAAPDQRPDPEYVGYRYLFKLDGGVFAVNLDERVYKLDPETGSLVDSWQSNQLPLGEGVVDLPAEIQTVHEDVDRVYVRVFDDHAPLHCLDTSGDVIWTATGRRGTIHFVDGTLYEYLERGPRTYHWYRLDEDTGERLEETEKPDL